MADSSKASDPGGKMEIKVVEARKLATLGKSPLDDRFLVKLSLGNQASTTGTKNRAYKVRSNVVWNEVFMFTFAGQMPNLTLEVFAVESDRTDVFIGRTIVSYADLSSGGSPEIGIAKPHTFSLSDEKGVTIAKGPTLKILVKMISAGIEEHVDDLESILEEAKLSVQQASDALGQLKGPKIPGLPLEEGPFGSAVVGAAGDLGSILSKIGMIADIMGELTKIHPYAKAAWDILDLTRKVVKAQMKEDESIRDLSAQMGSLLDRIQQFVEKLDGISPSDRHTDEEDVLRHVSTTSRECAEFIINFCEANFGKRAIKCALFGDASKKIGDFRSKFELLKKNFNEKVWDGTNIIAHQILANQMIGQFMVRSASLGASDKRACFTGTRVTIRKEITDWIERVDENVPRVLLLSGMAGTGKSTIAYTIASEWNDQDRPCAYFAFNRRAQPPPVARMLFPHIAASLAAFCPVVKAVLAEPKKRDIALGDRLEPQLKELIIAPLKQSALAEPVLLAFDALDEADDNGEQATEVASLLSATCGQLPPNIRILVTSRPEVYISDRMQPPTVLALSMPDSWDTTSDVGVFIRAQLLPLHLNDITEECCGRLAETSQGLFQWAATACNEIKAPLRGESTPYQRYEAVVASGIGRDKSGLLDSLYKSVLERAYNLEKNPHGHCLLKKVFAALFVLWEPMTLDTFGRLLGEGSEVEATLPDLASILDGISNRTRPIQPSHTSLRDFFLDPDRSGSFCVEDLMPGTHDRAARGSLKIVSSSLRQHAYTLDLACLDDGEYVKSKAVRIHEEMPPDVEYPILYWVKHLAEAPTPQEAFWTDMETSFLCGNLVLLWVEIFCLLVIYREDVYKDNTHKLNGCIGLLVHIMKRPGSTCPAHVLSVAESLSTIINTEIGPPFRFEPVNVLRRLRRSDPAANWIVQLQSPSTDAQPEPVPIGSGFIIDLPGAAHIVILTTAHNLLDKKGALYQEVVVQYAEQAGPFPNLSNITQKSVLSKNIRICAKYQPDNPEHDWGAIWFVRDTETKTSGGFSFEPSHRSEDPTILTLGAYGVFASGASIDVKQRNKHEVRLRGPITSGAPLYWSRSQYRPHVQYICNSSGNDTELTPEFFHELCSWAGIGKYRTTIRLLSLPLSDAELSEDEKNTKVPRIRFDNLYLHVNNDDRTFYFRRGSDPTRFNVYPTGTSPKSWTLECDLGRIVVEDERLVCLPAPSSLPPIHSNTQINLWVEMTDSDLSKICVVVRNCYEGGVDHLRFGVAPKPIAGSEPHELFELTLLPSRGFAGVDTIKPDKRTWTEFALK